MVKYGWKFESSLKDEFYYIGKMNTNVMKFFTKFYDINRTNLHDDFRSINYPDRILEIF